MRKFKDSNNQIHEIKEGFEHLLPDGCVEIDQAEFDLLTTPTPKTQAELDVEFNAQVDAELDELDASAIRILLEWASTMSTAPQLLKDKKVAADALRATRKS